MGESFRLGGEGTRNIGSVKSVGPQIDAAKSHMNFVENLEKKDCTVDIYINTYNTIYNDKLLDVYKNNLIGSLFHHDKKGTKYLLDICLTKIETNKYDFILLSRIDIFYKEEFLSVFKHDWENIRFASICFKPFHKVKNLPRVNPILIFIPKKYYNYMSEYIDISSHNVWYYLINNTDLKIEDLDTMLNTYHDSDSSKDFNPIYYIVNRTQSEKFSSPGQIFDKFNF